MDQKKTFVVEGLAGEKKLRGAVKIKGAKNAVLKAMAASVLFKTPLEIANAPRTDDVQKMESLLLKLGATVTWTGSDRLIIDTSNVSSSNLDKTLSQGMRSSVVLTGPLLARFKEANFPAPGGCVIGTRPIDLFIDGYNKMGASVEETKEQYIIRAPHSLKGAEIFFPFQTVGGTETLMMAAVLAQGTTVLKNCAMEPEIASLAEFLVSCGADIRGAGTTTITIVGGSLLSSNTPYMTVPDRVEAGSFLILGALCAQELIIEDCLPEHLGSVIGLLKGSGVGIEVAETSIKVKAEKVKGESSKKPFNVRTHEYPGFPTDLQAPIVVYLTQMAGESIVLETIYEARFKYVRDLVKLGANIKEMNPREVMIKGPTPFIALPQGDELSAYDIRAGFAVILAALVAKGTSTINNTQFVDRGYEKLEERLRALGVDIKRV